MNLLKRIGFHTNTYNFNDSPIESFNILFNVKCFTFFSYISQSWKDIQIDFIKFGIDIIPKYNWIPPHMIKRYYLALHSPKSIPLFEYGSNFIEIKPNKAHAVTFNKINVDVNNAVKCHNYDDDEYLSSDCIAICVLTKIQNKYGRLHVMDTLFLYMENYSKLLRNFNQSHYFEPDKKDLAREFKPECMQQCKPDCSFSYYLYDISIGAERSTNDYDKESRIYIYHKQIADIYIKHIPEATFISFISNFGGLLGMWLGVSVILILENIFQLLKRLIEHFSKPKHTKLFIQHIQNNIILNENLWN